MAGKLGSGPAPSRRGPAFPADPSQVHLKRVRSPCEQAAADEAEVRAQGIAKDPVWMEVGRRREMRSPRSLGWATC